MTGLLLILFGIKINIDTNIKKVSIFIKQFKVIGLVVHRRTNILLVLLQPKWNQLIRNDMFAFLNIWYDFAICVPIIWLKYKTNFPPTVNFYVLFVALLMFLQL